MLPACCLPLWGREGVTLPAAAENKRITGKRGFQQSLFSLFIIPAYTKQIFSLFKGLFFPSLSGIRSSGQKSQTSLPCPAYHFL
jgi:hypothetical protein